MAIYLKNTVMKSSAVSDHLSRGSKRHSGVHTVTPTARAAAVSETVPKRESPFGALVMGDISDVPQKAYKPIFSL